MADISVINVNGTGYNIKDSTAMRLITSAVSGNVLTTNASGQATDSGTTMASKQNVVLSGTSEPSSSLGVNGDIYIKYTV